MSLSARIFCNWTSVWENFSWANMASCKQKMFFQCAQFLEATIHDATPSTCTNKSSSQIPSGFLTHSIVYLFDWQTCRSWLIVCSCLMIDVENFWVLSLNALISFLKLSLFDCEILNLSAVKSNWKRYNRVFCALWVRNTERNQSRHKDIEIFWETLNTCDASFAFSTFNSEHSFLNFSTWSFNILQNTIKLPTSLEAKFLLAFRLKQSHALFVFVLLFSVEIELFLQFFQGSFGLLLQFQFFRSRCPGSLWCGRHLHPRTQLRCNNLCEWRWCLSSQWKLKSHKFKDPKPCIGTGHWRNKSFSK